ncbi:MAG: NADH-quinone oxidoreductase subunit NuoE [Gemmatimonadota bacterium]
MSRKIHPAVAGAQPFQRAEREAIEGPILDTPEGRERLASTLSRYPVKRAALLPLLGFVQEKKGWVSPADMVEVAAALDLTPAYVRSVATFYTMYNKHPVGRYLVQVCTNISCHLNRAEEVLRRFLEETGTREGEISDDGLFTVIEAECLGACGFATVAQINDEYWEEITPERVPEVVAGLRARAGNGRPAGEA